MTSVATLDPGFVSALGEAVDVLRSVAEYELEDGLQQRMSEQACQAADDARRAADQARQAAEAEVARLREELRRRG